MFKVKDCQLINLFEDNFIGSTSLLLNSPELPFDVKSGSGDLEIKVPGIKLVQAGAGDVSLANATIRTGSGDIRLGTSRKKQSASKSKKEAVSKAKAE